MGRSLAVACAAAMLMIPFAGEAKADPHGPTTIVTRNADGTHTVEQVGNQRTHSDYWKQGLIYREYVVLETYQYSGRW